MQTIFVEIDATLPPYYIPNYNPILNQFVPVGSPPQGGQLSEPYSELADFLDKDDFTNLLSILGQFAGKTGSGLLSFGENILNQFVFKKTKKPESETQDTEQEQYVPGQKVASSPSANSNRSSMFDRASINSINLNQSNQADQQADYKHIVKEQAYVATQKLSTIGKSVWGLIGSVAGKQD